MELPHYSRSSFDLINTLNPFSPTSTSAHLTPTPDLYGPFWTLTTLIFTLFVTFSLAYSIVSYLSSNPVEYDFALLSTAKQQPSGLYTRTTLVCP